MEVGQVAIHKGVWKEKPNPNKSLKGRSEDLHKGFSLWPKTVGDLSRITKEKIKKKKKKFLDNSANLYREQSK